MPPQGYVVLAGLGWNYAASRSGRPTISRFCAHHKPLTLAATAAVVAWWGYHIATYVIPAVAEALDDLHDIFDTEE